MQLFVLGELLDSSRDTKRAVAEGAGGDFSSLHKSREETART